MDLSDLVHGLKPKSESKWTKSGGDRSLSLHPPPKDQSRQGQRSQSSDRSKAQQECYSERGSASGSCTHGKSLGRHASDRPQREQRRSPDSSSSSPPSQSASTRHEAGSSSGGTRLRCELCNRTFDSQSQFDKHTSVFHKRGKVPAKPREASFLCPFCGKAFTSPSKRNVHQNATHMGLRPFQCTVCNKAFGYKGAPWQPGNLRLQHMATHSGIKAHSCYICGAKFARNFYVKRHIETVHEKKYASK